MFCLIALAISHWTVRPLNLFVTSLVHVQEGCCVVVVICSLFFIHFLFFGLFCAFFEYLLSLNVMFPVWCSVGGW